MPSWATEVQVEDQRYVVCFTPRRRPRDGGDRDTLAVAIGKKLAPGQGQAADPAGRMRLIATIDDPAVIQRILAHLERPGARAGPPTPFPGSAAPAEQPALPEMTP